MAQSKITFDSSAKIWTGPFAIYPYGKKSAGEVVYEALMEDLEHVCQISDDSGEIYTNERMLKEAISVANTLKAKGVRKGDKIILLMHNHHYMLPTWLGCTFAGVILCPFYFLNSSVKAELVELVEQIQPKMMITSYLDAVDMFKSVFDKVKIECPMYIYENKLPGCHDLKPFFQNFSGNVAEFKPEGVSDPDKDLLVIVLSSSTTGKPKLINGTHAKVLFESLIPFSNMTVGSLMAPGWHSEFIATFVILIRCCVRVIRAFYTIEDFLQMIEKHKIEVIYMNPKDIFQMIKSETIKTINFEDVCLVVSVGAHMSIKMAEELQQYLPNGMIISTYAISDIGGAVAELSDLRGHVHQLVGKVRSGCQFVVLDNDGNRLGPKMIGEFGIKNTVVPFPGYYKNDKMTKESMNDDGFFYTGDCGYLDEEGNIFLTERKKFNIPYCGKMINQNDVERFILENVKGVAGVCVVDFNSDEHGTVPYIAVIPEKGKMLKETEIIKTVMEHHPFEFETKVFFFEQLPMTISGKYRKHLVREMIMEANHV